MTETATLPTAVNDEPTYRTSLATARVKEAVGERLDRTDLFCLHMENVEKLLPELARHAKAGKFQDALFPILAEIASVSVKNRLERERLEDRVAALERAAKPRVRVKAQSRERA